MLSTAGVCYFLDGYTWSVKLLKESLESLFGFLPPKIEKPFIDLSAEEKKRVNVLSQLSTLKHVVFNLPREALKEIYETLFDPSLESKIQEAQPDASQEIGTVTKAIMQLNYLISLSEEFKPDASHSGIIMKAINLFTLLKFFLHRLCAFLHSKSFSQL